MKHLNGLILLAVLPFAVGGATEAPVQQQCATSTVDGDHIVPAGISLIGDDDGYADEHGTHREKIAAFRIDRHEVTNRQFGLFVNATGYVTDAERTGDSIAFVPPSEPVDPAAWWKIVKGADWRHPFGPGSSIAGRDNLPVVQVSYADAATYARWAGRRLPSEAEFEYAARAGASGNSHDQPDLDEANTWQGRFPHADEGKDGHSGLAPVSCYKPNAYGLTDMIGNAWEWTNTPFAPDHRTGSPTSEEQRVIKGGSYICTPYYCARYRPAARRAQDVHGATSHISFRTVAIFKGIQS